MESAWSRTRSLRRSGCLLPADMSVTEDGLSAFRPGRERKSMMSVRIERVVTAGVLTLNGNNIGIENNIWLIGDDAEVLVIDASHDASAIVDRIGSRHVSALLITHGHSDHINVAAEVISATGAPVRLHAEDRMLWDRLHPGIVPQTLYDGQALDIAGTAVTVIHAPGHTLGSVCIYVADLGVLFSGDTLFPGGPGATGQPFSSYPGIISSIRSRLLPLPGTTRVLPGHGEETTIAAEAPGIPACG